MASSANLIRTTSLTMATALLLTIPAVESAKAGTPPRSTARPAFDSDGAKAGWQTDRIIKRFYDRTLMATSSSRVVAIVAARGDQYDTRGRTLVVRRDPHGGLATYRKRIGSAQGLDVDSAGNIIVTSERGKSIFVTTWRRDASRPTTSRLVSGASFPGLGMVELLSNDRGDAAVVAYSRAGYMVVRKHANRLTWRHPLTLRYRSKSGALSDLSLAPNGRLVGAFVKKHTVSLRTLDKNRLLFGSARTVLRWPDFPEDTGEYASVTVGPRGSLVVALNSLEYFAKSRPPGGIGPLARFPVDNTGSHVVYDIRYAILSPRQAKFRGSYAGAGYGYFDDPVIGVDGSVAFWSGLAHRWSARSREWEDAGFLWPAANNERGDLLLLDNEHLARQSVWPLRKQAKRAGRGPAGDGENWGLTNNGTMFVLSQRENRPGYYLSTKKLDYR